MKFLCLLITLGFGFLAPGTARAQLSLYANFSATRLTDLTASRVLYGPTVGVILDAKSLPRMNLGVDFRGSFVGSNGARLDGILIGPRVATHIRKFKPYGEFLIGFARYNNGGNIAGSANTDSEIELNAGLDYKVTKHFDWRVVDYSYGKYFGFGGNFNPREYSTGVVFHLP